MKRFSITILVLFMVLAIACNKSSQESTASKSGTSTTTTQTPPLTIQTSKASPDTLANRAAAANPVVTQTTAPGMNPPHGQPNHRCDIAVGAPLNSLPGTGKTPPPGSQLTMPAQSQPAITSTAPGMNPPHGQPNHRCDIAVGAPLNSPPGQTK